MGGIRINCLLLYKHQAMPWQQETVFLIALANKLGIIIKISSPEQ
jgi:hypothetical protein